MSLLLVEWIITEQSVNVLRGMKEMVLQDAKRYAKENVNMTLNVQTTMLASIINVLILVGY